MRRSIVILGALLLTMPATRATAQGRCSGRCQATHARQTRLVDKAHEHCIARADRWKAWQERVNRKARDPEKVAQKVQARYERSRGTCDRQKTKDTERFASQLDRCEKYCARRERPVPAHEARPPHEPPPPDRVRPHHEPPPPPDRIRSRPDPHGKGIKDQERRDQERKAQEFNDQERKHQERRDREHRDQERKAGPRHEPPPPHKAHGKDKLKDQERKDQERKDQERKDQERRDQERRDQERRDKAHKDKAHKDKHKKHP